MAYLGRNPAIGTQRVLDSLESQFNGSLTTFNLRYNSNTIYPTLASSLIVSLGGVLQEPGTAYDVASDQITFASAPATGTDCWILLYSEFGAQAAATPFLTVANNAIIGGELHGPSNFIIDPAVIGNNTGTVEIKGNLTVQGTTTTINSTTVDLDTLSLGDNEKISLGAGGVGDNGGAVESDLEIYSDGTNAYFDSGFIASTASPNIYFRTSATTTLDTNALTILNTGQVVINDDAADHASTNFDDLIVGNSSSAKRSGITIVSANNQDGAICFSKGTGSSDKQRGRILYMHDPSSAANEYLDFYVAGSHKLRIDGDGRILAGHNAGNSQLASAKLQILGGNDANNIAIINSAASDNDNARSGNLLFRGSQSGNEKSTLAAITGSHDGTADDQKGKLVFNINDGSDGDAPTEMVRINNHGLSIKNSTNTSALCVNNVRGTSGDAPTFNEANADGLLVDVYNTGNPYPRYVSLAARGYGAATADMSFWTDSGSSVVERLRITAAGNVGIGTDDPSNARLQVVDSITQTFGNAPLAIFGSGFAAGYYSTIGFGPTDSSYTVPPVGIGYVATSQTGGGLGDLVFGTRNVTTNTAPTERLRIDSSGHVTPGADDTQDLGSTSKRWRNIYTGDLQLSNEGSSNEVDGTWGNYTIQEGEEELFIINRRSGKKFKFVLEEVK